MPKFDKLKKAMKILEEVPTVEAQKALRESNPEKYAEYLRALDEQYGPKAQRAADMGFNPDTYYHGTANADIHEFRPATTHMVVNDGKPGSYFTPEIGSAEKEAWSRAYTSRDQKWSDKLKELEAKGVSDEEADKIANLELEKPLIGETIYPVKIRDDLSSKFIDWGVPSRSVKTQNPGVRSTQAAFDPRFKDSPDLLAFTPKKGMEGVRPQDYFNKGMDVLDKQVANRSRAALMALMQGQSPIDAAIENKNVDEAEIGRTILDKTDPNSYVHNANIPKNNEVWKDYLQTPVGIAATLPIDPTNYIPMGGGAKAARIANPERFNALKKMFQVGDKMFPAANAEDAIRIKRALEATEKAGTNKVIRDLGRPQGFGKVTVKE